VGILEAKGSVGRPCVGGKLKLKWILNKTDGGGVVVLERIVLA
jgi:hypothetical protein